MSVIAIDSSARGRVVVVRAAPDGVLLAERLAVGEAGVLALQRGLAGLIEDGIEAVVVVTGPGSYTGLRAGIAGGLGLAQARGLPLHGVGSLEVVATIGAGRRVLALADAGRGGVYAGWFEAGESLTAPVRLRLAELEAGEEIVSLDDLDIPGLRRGDPGPALAAAVPLGLSRPALDLAGLSATYVEEAVRAPEEPQVSSS